MTDTPKLLVYHQLVEGYPIDPPLWIAIVKVDFDGVGDGVVIAAPATPVTVRREFHAWFKPGDPFTFGAGGALPEGAIRETWGLDAVDDAVAAAYLKQLHLGKLS